MNTITYDEWRRIYREAYIEKKTRAETVVKHDISNELWREYFSKFKRERKRAKLDVFLLRDMDPNGLGTISSFGRIPPKTKFFLVSEIKKDIDDEGKEYEYQDITPCQKLGVEYKNSKVCNAINLEEMVLLLVDPRQPVTLRANSKLNGEILSRRNLDRKLPNQFTKVTAESLISHIDDEVIVIGEKENEDERTPA